MKKFFVLFVISLCALSSAEREYLGLYMGGNKIGYASYDTHPDTLDGKKVSRTDSLTLIDAGVLGEAMTMRVEGTTWIDAKSHPLKMMFLTSSAGRSQKVVASFGSKYASIDIENNGQKTHENLPIPSGAPIVDDPLELVVGDRAAQHQTKSVYVLDPMTIQFMKTDVVKVGPRTTEIKGKKLTATLVQIVDPRLTTDVYVSAKGDFLKAEAMGIVMLPESREVALAKDSGYKPSADLALSTSIHPDKVISDPSTLTGLKLRVIGRDLSRIPSDDHQSVSKDGNSWVVDVHPPVYNADPAASIAKVSGEKAEWVKPSLDMPSDSLAFKELSSKILKGQKEVVPAALAIKDYVYSTMQPNAGIGVLRDAREILKTKEGVCRDYAVLTGTLMRSAGIPARLAAGVVNFKGDFYYHAWVEIWDGTKWIGIDSTVPEKQMSAAHVKLADGNVGDAFAFTFLDKVKIEVLDVRRK